MTFETAALPLEYMAYLLGHKFENGTMIAGKDDAPPYFAVMFQSDKRNGGIRYTKFYKVQFAEPSVKGSTKETNIAYQTPTLTAKAIYRLSDGCSYCYADTEDASFQPETAENWYLSVDGRETNNEPTGNEPTGSETTGNEQTGSEPNGNEPTGGEPNDNTPTGSEPTGGEPTGSATNGSEPTDDEPTNTEPDAGGE